MIGLSIRMIRMTTYLIYYFNKKGGEQLWHLQCRKQKESSLRQEFA